MGILRFLGMLAFTVLVAGLVPATAAASCVQTTVPERAALADVVVYGTVTGMRQTFAPASGVIRFQPERFLKGTLPGEVEVFLGPTKGGPITSVDYEAVVRGGADHAATHTLYLRPAGDGAWQTDACSGSHMGAPTLQEITFFGTGAAAPPAAPVNNTPFVLGAVAAAAVLIALVTVLVVRRRYPGGPSTLTTTSP